MYTERYGKMRCLSCTSSVRRPGSRYGSGLSEKSGEKQRRIEEKTVLLIQNGQEYAICKRPDKGLLAGLYEFPNMEGWLTQEEVLRAVEELKLMPLHIRAAGEAKHIFHMWSGI